MKFWGLNCKGVCECVWEQDGNIYAVNGGELSLLLVEYGDLSQAAVTNLTELFMLCCFCTFLYASLLSSVLWEI